MTQIHKTHMPQIHQDRDIHDTDTYIYTYTDNYKKQIYLTQIQKTHIHNTQIQIHVYTRFRYTRNRYISQIYTRHRFK